MGWSIKKPFGSKKSVFNQVLNVQKAAVAAVVAAPVAAVAPKTYQDILVKNDLMGKEEAAKATVASQVAVAALGATAIAAVAAESAAVAAAAKVAQEAKEAKEKADKLKEEAEALEKAAKAAIPQPPAPLRPAVAPAVVAPLFKDNSPIAPAATTSAPETIQAAASGETRDLDFLERFFAWLAGK